MGYKFSKFNIFISKEDGNYYLFNTNSGDTLKNFRVHSSYLNDIPTISVQTGQGIGPIIDASYDTRCIRYDAADLGTINQKFANLYLSGKINQNASGYGLLIPDTSSYVTNNIIATLSDIPTNYVTTDTTQTITGVKTVSQINIPLQNNKTASIFPYVWNQEHSLAILSSTNYSDGSWIELHSGNNVHECRIEFGAGGNGSSPHGNGNGCIISTIYSRFR